MKTSDRLQDYYPFPADIVERVSEVADYQAAMDYRDFFNGLGVPDVIKYDPKFSSSIDVLDIRPKRGHYGSQTQVLHLPHGNGLDPNMVYHAATIFAADPSVRTIAVGNPSRPGIKGGRLNHDERKIVASGNLRPTVEGVLDYLETNKIAEATHIGWSYGADKAVAAAKYAEKFDQKVVQTISIEPAAIAARGLVRLSRQFLKTGKYLQNYVEATELKAFMAARKNSVGLAAYGLALLRPTNFAIACALAKDGFEGHANEALLKQPEMKLDMVWGKESELATHGLMYAITMRLADKYNVDPNFRVGGTWLKSQYHNWTNDIHLLTATIIDAKA